MTPSAPTLQAFDPQIVGMVGLQVNPAPPSSVDTILYYAGSVSGGPYTQIAAFPTGTGHDGLRLVVDDSSQPYWVAKTHDSTGYSLASNQVTTVVSAGATQAQLINQALGITLLTGDIVDVYPATPTTSKTVQADGSLA